MATILPTSQEDRGDAQGLRDEKSLTPADAGILVRRIVDLMPSIVTVSATRIDLLLRRGR